MKTGSSSVDTRKNNFISGLQLVSMNINSIRGKQLELLASLDFHQHHGVAVQETSLQLQNCSQKLAHTMYTGRTETFMAVT